MSVDATSGPSPAFYSYPSTLPSALTTPIASSSQPATSAAPTASSTAAVPSPYQTEYDTLQQDDAAELLQVSLGSAANAQSNLASVLSQAAALQSQQLAAQQQQTLAAADAAVQTSPSSAASTAGSSASAASTDPLDVPTFQSVIDSSDSAANTNLGNYSNSGSSIDLLA
jgi:cytochrome bd-type quinol oxidase subunit 1